MAFAIIPIGCVLYHTNGEKICNVRNSTPLKCCFQYLDTHECYSHTFRVMTAEAVFSLLFSCVKG